MIGRWQILEGDCRAVLRTLADKSVHTIVTSPPYWGLRDYGVDGQFGLERTPEEYVANMVAVFREVRRVLRDDGTLWLNLGDCYATGAHSAGDSPGGGRQGALWLGKHSKHDVAKRHRDGKRRDHSRPKTNGRGEPQTQADTRVGPVAQPNRMPQVGLKPKDLVGMPWRVAFALQADGWFLRMDVIWNKSNPMPESVTDRPTKAHEYVFLMSKSERYYYDAEAIKEPVAGTAHPRGYGFHPKTAAPGSGVKANSSYETAVTELVTDRNKRSVWTIATEPFGGAHFATFPTELVKPCIFAGSSERGCCPRCRAPFERVTEKSDTVDDRGGRRKQADVMRRVGATSAFVTGEHQSTRTIAWQPTCFCEYAPGYPPPSSVHCSRSVQRRRHDRNGRDALWPRLRRRRTERRVRGDGAASHRRRCAALQRRRWPVLKLRPITLREANAHIAEHHAHHPPARGCKFVIGCYEGDDVRLCGVVIVERPKARMLQDGATLELSRVCTDRTRHVASKLIAAATRAAFAMGATRVISYILESEEGVSYRAAGWSLVEENDGTAVEVGGGSWSRDGRERDTLGLFGDVPKAPQGIKHRWEKIARGGHHAAAVTLALPPGESDEPYIETAADETEVA